MRSGPFAGMGYIREAVGSALVPKIVGTYEKELARLIESADSGYDLLVDVGAAEGYYAIGCSVRSRENRKCIAFEGNRAGRVLMRKMAELNRVSDRLQIEGFCTRESLSKALSQARHPLVICDCEGWEFELMDPEAVPELKRSAIILEVHGRAEVPPGDFADHPSAMAALLTSRFAVTHNIECIEIQQRSEDDWPNDLLKKCDRRYKISAMKEFRSPGPGWLWMNPKGSISSVE